MNSYASVLAQVLGLEQLPDVLGADLPAALVGDVLYDAAELDLEIARKVEVVVGLEEVGDSTLSGLAVDADDRLVVAPDVAADRREGRGRPTGRSCCVPARSCPS